MSNNNDNNSKKSNDSVIVSILKEKAIFLVFILVAFGLGVYVLGFYENAPIPAIFKNISEEKKLISEIEQKKKELARIQEENKTKNEAAKKATVKEFFKIQTITDTTTEFSPMFENVITMIKENGLRMKSIKYITTPTDDNLIKNGGGAYNGTRVDFELIGYYPQFKAFLEDLNNYPYFINIKTFEVKPYQYDKKIIITNLAIIFYAKR